MAAPLSPATDIAQVLADAGVGTLSVDLFVGLLPAAVEGLLFVIYDAPGSPPNAKWLRDEPTVQCFVRGAKYEYNEAWALAQLIKDTLLGHDPVVVNNSNIVLFTQIGDIFPLGADAQSRPRIVSNWQLVREYDSGGNRLPL